MIPTEKIKIGLKIKAHWDKTISEIVGIDGDAVTYKCYAYDSYLNKDGLFRDTISVIQQHFSIDSPQIGDFVKYYIDGKPVTAKVLDVLENNDIRTDQDGVRTADEYIIISKA